MNITEAEQVRRAALEEAAALIERMASTSSFHVVLDAASEYTRAIRALAEKQVDK